MKGTVLYRKEDIVVKLLVSRKGNKLQGIE